MWGGQTPRDPAVGVPEPGAFVERVRKEPEHPPANPNAKHREARYELQNPEGVCVKLRHGNN